MGRCLSEGGDVCHEMPVTRAHARVPQPSHAWLHPPCLLSLVVSTTVVTAPLGTGVQSELQSHIGHLYPAQLNTDAIELRRRLREIDTKVEESEDKAKQMGRCPSAALEDTADAMRDLRIRFRMFVECMLHFVFLPAHLAANTTCSIQASTPGCKHAWSHILGYQPEHQRLLALMPCLWVISPHMSPIPISPQLKGRALSHLCTMPCLHAVVFGHPYLRAAQCPPARVQTLPACLHRGFYVQWLLQMQDLCDPELKMVGPRLAELRKRVTCTPELGPLQRKLGNFSASLNNAVHARQPGIHHDDVGNLLREVVLLNGMLTEYRDFIQTQNLVHELPEVWFVHQSQAHCWATELHGYLVLLLGLPKIRTQYTNN
eukprot:scaffold186838_cov20-Tisochrysis_lutea.AAC.1